MFFILMVIPRLLSELAKANVTGIKVKIAAFRNTGASRKASREKFLKIKKVKYK